jgi:hypothetical protein
MRNDIVQGCRTRGRDAFVLEGYNRSKPFASFFPGIAGETGIPLWTFYVNRAQAVCSMGVRDKDRQILEFLSFHKALQLVGAQGFRTFIRAGGETYEPFATPVDDRVRQTMTVSSAELSIVDRNPVLGIETAVDYFQLPEEQLPALVRRVQISNIGTGGLSIELVDGLPRIIPHGMDRKALHVTPRHSEGLMKVYGLRGVPLYRLKIDPEDKPEIELLPGSNFYLTFAPCRGGLLHDYLVDPRALFGGCESLARPVVFLEGGLEAVRRMPQVRENRTPAAFTAFGAALGRGETLLFYSVIGFAADDAQLEAFLDRASSEEWFERKRVRNRLIVGAIKDRMWTVSSSETFDGYCGQTFLDNVLRGGMPAVFDTAEGKRAYYLYSRQNGDLERDYHDFVLEPTYYSQGNGHFRCVLQNRRMDNFFSPEIGDSNIRFFLDAMQLDGYNAVEVRSTTFSVADRNGFEGWLASVPEAARGALRRAAEAPFMPGEIVQALESAGQDRVRAAGAMRGMMRFARQNLVIDPHHRVGFWIDHWCYTLDLVEAYLRIFPERLDALLFDTPFTFYDSPDFVLPRDERQILADGRVRQYASVVRDGERAARMLRDPGCCRQVRTEHGRGGVFQSNMAVKLLTLIANRLGGLDPQGIGYEMEANMPGWNDSINGLPGILGSSLCHSLQLRRFCAFLRDGLARADSRGGREVAVFEELRALVDGLKRAIEARLRDDSDAGRFAFWDAAHEAKERYRLRVRHGVSGREEPVPASELRGFLDRAIALLDGLFSPNNRDRVFHPSGIPYTYFINDAVEWRETGRKDAAGRPLVKARGFTQRPVALFLEGPVHLLRVKPEWAGRIYRAIRESPLYDRKLRSYRNNASLEGESYEIGRIKAWGRGWLENESLYTHMYFKYLLEILRAGLYEEFFDDARNALMPFLDPAVYGRSVFENVSFIVSSAFVDETLHGNGFQARLSGSTCEFIQIWTILCAGARPFDLDGNGSLRLRLAPLLPGRFFTERERSVRCHGDGGAEEIRIPADCFAFRFLGKTRVVYHNPGREDTFRDGVGALAYALRYRDGREQEIRAAVLGTPEALAVREGLVERIDVTLGRAGGPAGPGAATGARRIL